MLTRIPLGISWLALTAFLALPLLAMLVETVWTRVDNAQQGGVVATVADGGRTLVLEPGTLQAKLDQPVYRDGTLWPVVDGFMTGDGHPVAEVRVAGGLVDGVADPGPATITVVLEDPLPGVSQQGITPGSTVALAPGSTVALAPGSYFSLDAWGDLLGRPKEWLQMGRSLLAGLLAACVAVLLGLTYTWCTWRTDLPGGGWLGPMAVAPLVVPPIVLAMSMTELVHPDVAWIPLGGILMGISSAPFVAVLTARGLRAVDGRIYESAVLCRGRAAADRLLLRLILPEIAAGALFAFLLCVAEHGVMEFLSVLQENRLTYAEGVFGRWNLRTSLGTHRAIASASVGAVPLVAITLTALWFALRFRAHSSGASDQRPLPVRRFGVWRWGVLALPVGYLALALGMPIGVMAWWAAGGTRQESATVPGELLDRMGAVGTARETAQPDTLDWLSYSLERCFRFMGDDLLHSLQLAALVVLFVVVVAVPLAAAAWRGRRLPELLPAVAMGVPAILLGIGMVKVYNWPATDGFYDGIGAAICGYGTRFLPGAWLRSGGAISRPVRPRPRLRRWCRGPGRARPRPAGRGRSVHRSCRGPRRCCGPG